MLDAGLKSSPELLLNVVYKNNLEQKTNETAGPSDSYMATIQVKLDDKTNLIAVERGAR